MKLCRTLLCCVAVSAFATPAHATIITLSADGFWNAFALDDQVGPLFDGTWIDTETLSPTYGSALDFTFTVPASSQGKLTVVDVGFAGDTFSVKNGAAVLGATSAVALMDFLSAPDAGLSFDTAFADARFSRGIFLLGPGSYHIGGSLVQSVTSFGFPLNATAGGVKLEVTAVPEPATLSLLLGGLAMAAARLRASRYGGPAGIRRRIRRF